MSRSNDRNSSVKFNDFYQTQWQKKENVYFSKCCKAIVNFYKGEPMCTVCKNKCDLIDLPNELD